MLVLGIDALRFHRAALEQAWLSSTSIPVSALLGAECLVVVVAVASLIRQGARQRAFLAALPFESRSVLGVPVLVIASRRPHAFCVGWLRPRIVVSDGLIARLTESELRSVLAHECHHARRHDPLRRAVVKAMCDGLWFIPALRSTARTQAAISELAADAVAIRSAGVRPLAGAMVTFEKHGGSGAGPSAERVGQLVGEAPHRAVTAPALAVAGAVVVALGSALVYLLRPVPAELCLPLSTALGAPLAVLMLALACVPAGLLGRTAARNLDAR